MLLAENPKRVYARIVAISGGGSLKDKEAVPIDTASLSLISGY
jgi:hypothetical protein